MPKPQAPGTVATNRRARHDYEILETVEAGIVLQGSEVKTLREGRASLQDAYAAIEGRDVVLYMQIPRYSHTGIAGYEGHDPVRPRKLLLHRDETERLAQRVRERGLTLVPLRMYFKAQLVKVELGLARGKRAYDKRQAIAQRDADREMARVRKARTREG
jgi:SsrA-binding protein